MSTRFGALALFLSLAACAGAPSGLAQESATPGAAASTEAAASTVPPSPEPTGPPALKGDAGRGPTGSALPPPAGLDFQVGPAVSEEDLAAVREGTAVVSRYLAATLGGDRTGPAVARIRVGAGTEEHCCFAGPGGFDIITSNHFWTTPSAPSPETWPASTERRELAAHEYVHVWQYEVGGGGCMRGPARWLAEGMAEWVAYHSLIEAGLITETQLETFIGRQLRSGRYVPLWDLLRAWPFDVKPYAVGYLAVDRLVESSGPLALRDWCERVGAGEEWTAAFESAFGEPVEDFYVRFEAYRSNYAR